MEDSFWRTIGETDDCGMVVHEDADDNYLLTRKNKPISFDEIVAMWEKGKLHITNDLFLIDNLDVFFSGETTCPDFRGLGFPMMDGIEYTVGILHYQEPMLLLYTSDNLFQLMDRDGDKVLLPDEDLDSVLSDKDFSWVENPYSRFARFWEDLNPHKDEKKLKYARYIALSLSIFTVYIVVGISLFQ